METWLVSIPVEGHPLPKNKSDYIKCGEVVFHQYDDPSEEYGKRFVPNPDKITRERILQIQVKGKPIKEDVYLNKIAEMTEGFSGADVSSIANTAVSLVLHDFIQKYPSPEEALKHTLRHFEDAIKKVKGQKEMKPEEKINLSHYK